MNIITFDHKQQLIRPYQITSLVCYIVEMTDVIATLASSSDSDASIATPAISYNLRIVQEPSIRLVTCLCFTYFLSI